MTRPESNAQRRAGDVALLVLRLGAGLSLFIVFGLQKVHDLWQFLHTGQWTFVDFNRRVGLPVPVLVAVLQTLNESVLAVLLAVGLLGRVPAGFLTLGFAGATYYSLKADEPIWMLAAYFFLMFLTLLVSGPGRFSLDSLLRSQLAKSKSDRDAKASAAT
ncbi:MAG TPA: DoxX family protein [Steroidobacteraceae bacterium]|jgi:uncharacterized membrane protein YphA (DoxX/SURF4 family)